MGLLLHLRFVALAGLLTALAIGLGAVPFVLFAEFSDRWTVALWGMASGIMIAASLLGLVREGIAYDAGWLLAPGALTGVGLVIASDSLLSHSEVDPREHEEADFRKLVLILGVLTIHSFPEGVAVGVAFAELGLETTETVEVLGVGVPVLGML